MTSRSMSGWLAPALVGVGAILTVWNWYLQPDRALVWAVVMLLFGCMTWALRVDSRRRQNAGYGQRSSQSIQAGVLTAGLIMALCLGGVLAKKLGVAGDSNLSWRGTMIILGIFFAVTGNSIPKVLPPLSAARYDAASVQACRRAVGWTWVLTGLGFTACWLLLPVETAQTISLPVLMGGMITMLTWLIRLRFSQN